MDKIEQVARALCMAAGFDPDELAADYMMEKDRVAAGNPARRWENYKLDAETSIEAYERATDPLPAAADALREAGEKLAQADDLQTASEVLIEHCGYVDADPGENFVGLGDTRDEAFTFPGEDTDPPAVAPETLEQYLSAEADRQEIEGLMNLSQGELIAELRRLSRESADDAEMIKSHEDTILRLSDLVDQKERRGNDLLREAQIGYSQLHFTTEALTRQFERVAGLRMFIGDLRAGDVMNFVQVEVAAIDAQLHALRKAREPQTPGGDNSNFREPDFREEDD